MWRWGQFSQRRKGEEIAAELGISLNELHATAQRLNGLTLVGQKVNAAYDRERKTDLIESAPSREEGPYDLCLRSEIRNRLSNALRTLSEKEQMVISLYYKEELTMREIAALLQVGESRVCQIHSLALPKLRANLRRVFDQDTR